MKKTIYCLMLLGITGNLFAQPHITNSDKTFDLPPGFATKQFVIELGKGNKMQIELSDVRDLKQFENIDSLIRTFLADIELLKDSLGDETLSRRIDYTTDSAGRKKIRLQKFNPKGTSFLVKEGDVASLKLEQDTINFIGSTSYIIKQTFQRPVTNYKHYRISFFLNDLSDLALYMDGSLNRKIKIIQDDSKSTWVTTAARDKAYLKKEPSITAKVPNGTVGGGTYLTFRATADIQNYKHYFVPSFSLGAGVGFSNSRSKKELFLSWDPHFMFGKENNNGKLKTFRNDFVTLTFSYLSMKHGVPTNATRFKSALSFGYLVKREGEFYEKGTVRLGVGRLSFLGGITEVEPVIYLPGDGKKATPGIRLIQNF